MVYVPRQGLRVTKAVTGGDVCKLCLGVIETVL